MTDLKKLRELAEKAMRPANMWHGPGPEGPSYCDEDNNFIAAADPQTILKLLDVVDAARLISIELMTPTVSALVDKVRPLTCLLDTINKLDKNFNKEE